MPKTTPNKKSILKNDSAVGKTRVFPGFAYKLKADFSANAIALTDDLFAVPGEPASKLEDGGTHEISGNGICKKARLSLSDKVQGKKLLQQYSFCENKINGSIIYELWRAVAIDY